MLYVAKCSHHCRVILKLLFMRTAQSIMHVLPTRVKRMIVHERARVLARKSVGIPEIVLCGSWLARFGFLPHQRIKVITNMNEIVIKLDPVPDESSFTDDNDLISDSAR